LRSGLLEVLTDRVSELHDGQPGTRGLAALGKLSAGLAHELNNPSAAARRSAGALRDCLARLREVGRSSTIGPEDCALLAKREEENSGGAKAGTVQRRIRAVEREESDSILVGNNTKFRRPGNWRRS